MSNSLLEFATYQESRGITVTPELRQVGHAIEERKEAQRRYANRPLHCKLGLHKRRPSVWGDVFVGTCLICWRNKL